MSENRRILAPHKEQDGWVYYRMRPVSSGNLAARVRNWTLARIIDGTWCLHTDGASGIPDDVGFAYLDDVPGSRVISSRRVEEAVETADYLKRCAEEGLVAVFDYSDGWHVGLHTRSVAPLGGQRVTGAHGYGSGATLREAYWRYKNAVAR